MFRDLGKPVKNLFEDDYFSGQRLKFQAKNESDITVSGEAELGQQKVPLTVLTIKRPGILLSLDKLRMKSDGRLLAEVSLKTSDYFKLTMSAEDGRQEPGRPIQSFGKVGVELTFPKLNLDADLDVVNGPLLRTSALYNHGNYKVGGETLINTNIEFADQSPEMTDFNVGFAYIGKRWTLVGRTTNLLSNMRLSYLHDISPKLLLAAQVDYHLKSNSQKIAVGTNYILEQDKSWLKAKFDSNATVATSFTHKLSNFAKLIVSAELNAHDWSTNSHKFGIGVSFE